MPDDFPLDRGLLGRVLDQLNIGAYITDRQRRIMVWNRKAAEITGHPAEKVVGTACWDNILQHIDKDGRQLCTTSLCPLLRSMNLGKASADPILVYARKADGARIAVSVSAAPLTDDSGNIVGAIETFRDESAYVADMEFAAKIQRHLFPRRLPSNESIIFDVRYWPHDVIGGDFYDVFEIEPNLYGIMVADVRGHGVSAALYTMWLKSLESANAGRAGDPPAMIGALNRAFVRMTVPDSFVTGLYGVFEAPTGIFTYCNAGHVPPLIYRAGSHEVSELESHGLPLGISSEEAYESSSVEVAAGDMVFLYTDGLADVAGKNGRMLTARDLSEILAAQIADGQEDLLDRIYQAVLDRSSQVALDDDCMMISARRPG